ncbi:ABC transporter ATP-binding protein [Rhizobium sp. P38BS-XIX]|uniref:oligopeptide/dipeptide ABC transporter ATP-binding protein n=1 Tax=Rhizobium sp. P38BS-XIX TaxID=2726740 RepID=UPI0014577459|nr:ABC transporter ATP-binding protein [Rhizobium sp. P38BS-XIX]NLS00448.1 ABC transporter ATP-binding protein [Rhizobium sp. P38BS-XIX]
MSPREMIALDGIAVAYDGRTRVLDNVSFFVEAGDTVGIVGESGSGKSTMCRVIVGLADIVDGSRRIQDQPIEQTLKRDRRAFRRRVQMLMQDAVATLSPRMTIGSLMMEAVAIHGLDRERTKARVTELAERLRLPPSILDRYPHEVSGGQARRIGVIRALLLEPSLLVADEPTAGLDVSVQGELLNVLLEFQREMGLTFVMVSHNLHVVRRVTNRTLVMYLGQIIEDCPTRQLFDQPAHPYTTALLSTNPRLSELDAKPIVLKGEIPSIASPPTGCRFHTRCPVSQPRCASEMPQLMPIDHVRKVRCHFPYSLELPSGIHAAPANDAIHSTSTSSPRKV